MGLMKNCCYQTRDEARIDVIKYIEMFYNSNRLHSFLGYKNPMRIKPRSVPLCH